MLIVSDNPLLDDVDDERNGDDGNVGEFNPLLDVDDEDDSLELPVLTEEDILPPVTYRVPTMVDGVSDDAGIFDDDDDEEIYDEERDDGNALIAIDNDFQEDHQYYQEDDNIDDENLNNDFYHGDTINDSLSDVSSSVSGDSFNDESDNGGLGFYHDDRLMGSDDLNNILNDDSDDDYFSDSSFEVSEDYDEDDELEGFNIDEIISTGIDLGASDVHINPGNYVGYTLLGDSVKVKKFGVVPGNITQRMLQVIATNVAQDSFSEDFELDTSYTVKTGRYRGRRLRVSVGYTFGDIFFTFRIISDRIPTPEELNVDDRIKSWIELNNGLVLICGPTGTGKALHKDTMIPTPQGFKKVSHINPGDTIFDSSGDVTRVIDIHANNDSRHFSMLFNNGEEIRSAENHLWKVYPRDKSLVHGEDVFGRGVLSRNDYQKCLDFLHEYKIVDDGSDNSVVMFNDIMYSQIVTPVDILDFCADSDSADIISFCQDYVRCHTDGVIDVLGNVVFSLINIIQDMLVVSDDYFSRVDDFQNYGFCVLSSGDLYSWFERHGNFDFWRIPLMKDPVVFDVVNDDSLCDNLLEYFSVKDYFDLGRVLSEKFIVVDDCSFVDVVDDFINNNLVSLKFSGVDNRCAFIAGVVSFLVGNVSLSGNSSSFSVRSFNEVFVDVVRDISVSLGMFASVVSCDDDLFIFSFDVNVLLRDYLLLFDVVVNDVVDGFYHIVDMVSVNDVDDYVCFEVDSLDHTFMCSSSFIVTHNSTTFASLIRKIQLEQPKKIITVENPIEYLYGVDGRSIVVQREIGMDARSFSSALDSAMRQAPDLIMVGEIRNRNEVDQALRASETGHLTLSTMHTSDAWTTVNRISSLYEGDEQARVLSSLKDNLRGIANQVLVKSIDGKSRFSVYSVLEINDEISHYIGHRDTEKIKKYMKDNGLTIEHQLVKAVNDKKCTVQEARVCANDRQYFDEVLKNNSIHTM